MFKRHQCSILKFCFRSLGNAGLQEASSTPCMSAAKRRQQHRSALCVSYQYVNPSAELRGTQTSAAAHGSSSVTSGHPTDVSSSQFNNLHLRVDHVKHCHSRLTTCTEFAKFYFAFSFSEPHRHRAQVGGGIVADVRLGQVLVCRRQSTSCKCIGLGKLPAAPQLDLQTMSIRMRNERSDQTYWLRPHANFHEDLQVPTF